MMRGFADDDQSIRLRAGALSLVVGSILLAVKFGAYQLTGSHAIKSDALESIVNVLAAIFALGGLVFAGRPADRNHPYGHGKIEFISAIFEGGMITFAAILIIYEAVVGLLEGTQIRQVDLGMALTLGAGLANAALGWYLIRTGTRYHSLTLLADGKHVMADFWTSAGVVFGLLLVRLTGYQVLDPIVAGIVGINLGFTGYRLVRHAAGGLLDEEDTSLLEKVIGALNANRLPGIIRVHHLRAIRSGHFTHVDAHLVVPEYWTVERSHELADEFEQKVITALPFEGEIAFHTDPCHRAYCSACSVTNCPVRRHPFESAHAITLDEAVEDDATTIERMTAGA